MITFLRAWYVLVCLVVPSAASAGKLSDLTVNSFEYCYIGKKGPEGGTEIIFCTDDLVKGRGLVIQYIESIRKHNSNDKVSLLCHSKAYNKTKKNELKVQVYWGECDDDIKIKNFRFNCTDVGNSKFACKHRRHEFLLTRVGPGEI